MLLCCLAFCYIYFRIFFSFVGRFKNVEIHTAWFSIFEFACIRQPVCAYIHTAATQVCDYYYNLEIINADGYH